MPCSRSLAKRLWSGGKVERKALSTIDFESAEADMGYKNENRINGDKVIFEGSLLSYEDMVVRCK